mmetsp:Transcript_36246/g.43735  ORF Transcript_36246/g.43735 Transcript_36246/m.43735 type:complete len:292 (-) Transcript_36246:1006-1881(-)|eukprot:CAMPEP_0197850812 /NCGR_PEP_ID=MMETSP1438-20131217/16468_1 /TAXON_ID=1461541 /ORGANISM="Pterosperma sp., Strain CCMP1384" /LENGTH=291 /DNA_ID=CAMNT_0043464177 /DNA_START=280 /DNA_END=1155 /DNA_ORIENTATION=+
MQTFYGSQPTTSAGAPGYYASTGQQPPHPYAVAAWAGQGMVPYGAPHAFYQGAMYGGQHPGAARGTYTYGPGAGYPADTRQRGAGESGSETGEVVVPPGAVAANGKLGTPGRPAVPPRAGDITAQASNGAAGSSEELAKRNYQQMAIVPGGDRIMLDGSAPNGAAQPGHMVGSVPPVAGAMPPGTEAYYFTQPGAAAVPPPGPTAGGELWLQDEREVKRQRRKQSNRESARRSRLRKQAECEELSTRVESLTNENLTLKEELTRLKESCDALEKDKEACEEVLAGAKKDGK